MIEQNIQATPFASYQLLKSLGHGAVSEILLAIKTSPNGCRKFYIIKRLLDRIATDADKLQGFIREGEIATSLSHQNIVCGHEYGAIEHNGKTIYYIATDFIFGKNLSQVQTKSQGLGLPIHVVLYIIHSVAESLIYAHNYCDPFSLQKQCIIHKDISPDNILLAYNGEVKTGDFGIARKGEAESFPGKITGKLRYMSPEQRNNSDMDHRSDIYSLGVVFWECLTGMKLFKDINAQTPTQLAVIPPIPHPCEKSIGIPKEIGDICMKCLEPDCKDRFQSAKDLCMALVESSLAGSWGSGSVNKYLLGQFSEEFRNESMALAQIVNAISFPFFSNQLSGDVMIGRNSLDPSDFDCSGLKVIEDSLVVTQQDMPTRDFDGSKQIFPFPGINIGSQLNLPSFAEKTAFIDVVADERDKTAILEITDLDTALSSLKGTELSMVPLSFLQQNTSLNLSANTEDITQTDHNRKE